MGRSVSVHKISRCILPLLCSHCCASCNCCHDPLIVKSAQTRPPFTGFSQLAHPSRCSRSTLTAVCFCASVSPGLCVHIGFATRHQIHHRLVTFILQWSVGSTVSGILIPQTCNVVVVLKQRLAWFQHLRSSSL